MNPAIEATHLLDVRNLSVSVFSGNGTKGLIHQVSISLRRDGVLILLGESGSGKTVLSRSLTKLFPPTHRMSVEGSVVFEGQQLLSLDEAELIPIRRNKIRYVFQEPMQSLNPLANVRTQLRFASDSPSKDDPFLNNALRSVGLEEDQVLDLFPHQLSIGMAQRVCIAMAILPSPSLLVADEPTSAVDATLRYTLIDLLMSIQHSKGMSLILITHDLNVARTCGDRIAVMYGGRIIESASRDAFFDTQLHPYSQLLVHAQLGFGKFIVTSSSASYFTTGAIPESGCRFHLHCPIAKDRCKESEPELERTPDEREVRCFYWK